MYRLSKAVIVASALSIAAAAVPAAADPVEQRKELMKTVVKSLKVVIPMVKGEVPFDGFLAADAMRTMNGVPDKFVKLFPEGTGIGAHPKTEASLKIWQNMKDFVAKAEGLKVASAQSEAAADKGLDELKAAVFGTLVKTCKGCHEAYRIKKEK